MSRAFSAVTLPAIEKNGDEAERETILRVSWERFTVPRDTIEEKVNFHGLTPVALAEYELRSPAVLSTLLLNVLAND